MAVVAIRQSGDPVLRATAEAVPAELFGSEKLRSIIADMADTMDAEPDGVAIAAPQIGIPYRIFLVRYDRMKPPSPETSSRGGPPREEGEPVPPPDLGVFINPTFVRLSQKSHTMDEGCLSVRGTYGKAKRKDRATVRAYDASGKPFERGGGGILAQAFQHEIDHLNGVLFTDHAEELVKISAKEREAHGDYDIE
ncbi:MAG TPA: peptide deformylase [Candidatus Paceibacterota bacterium]|nr:peptide deformylase [Candidatus Paceibacterota bacterium]